MFHSLSIMKQVKDTMHKVFWGILREQLNNDPPEYSQAMVLLTEIRNVCTITFI
jgi:hypothetical protein